MLMHSYHCEVGEYPTPGPRIARPFEIAAATCSHGRDARALDEVYRHVVMISLAAQ